MLKNINMLRMAQENGLKKPSMVKQVKQFLKFFNNVTLAVAYQKCCLHLVSCRRVILPIDSTDHQFSPGMLDLSQLRSSAEIFTPPRFANFFF